MIHLTKKDWTAKQVKVSDFGVGILHVDYSISLIAPSVVCECTKCGAKFHLEYAPMLGLNFIRCREQGCGRPISHEVPEDILWDL